MLLFTGLAAIIEGMQYAHQLNYKSLNIYTTNDFIVRYIKGQYIVREQHLQDLYNQIFTLAQHFKSFKVEKCKQNKGLEKMVRQTLVDENNSIYSDNKISLSFSKITFARDSLQKE